MKTQREPEGQPPAGDDASSRVVERSQLLPEERAAGSDDPEAQAEAVLAESDERTEHPEATRRQDSQTPDREN